MVHWRDLDETLGGGGAGTAVGRNSSGCPVSGSSR